MTYPGPGSPVALSQTDPSTFTYQTPFLANQAAMDAAFPTGTYQYDATGIAGAQSTSSVYGTDLYPTAPPYLTGTDLSDLQGMNPRAPSTFHFSPFPFDAAASNQFIFFTIRNEPSNAVVFDAGSSRRAPPASRCRRTRSFPGRTTCTS